MLEHYRTLFLCALLVFLPTTEPVTQLLFQTARATYGPRYMANFTLRVHNGSISTDMYLVRRLVPGLKTHMDIQFRLANAKRYQTLLSYDMDVCTTVIALKDNLLKKWFRSVLKYGNFMENCPVHPGHYYLNGWSFDPALVPKYLYPGDYRVKARAYFGKYRGKNEDFVVDCDVEVKLV